MFCKHFYNEPYYQYSKMTDGGGYHSCHKGHPVMVMHSDDLTEFRAKIKYAATCQDYDETEDGPNG